MDGVISNGTSEAEQGQNVTILSSCGIWLPIVLKLADGVGKSRILYVIFCAGSLGRRSNQGRSYCERLHLSIYK